mmetsp:Transcript_9494/g.40301  ORF Transcript_9494/g.40301 Transcript_9494/m.40301 type:complete len:227 (+) Transcript_9494:194-874(+)
MRFERAAWSLKTNATTSVAANAAHATAAPGVFVARRISAPIAVESSSSSPLRNAPSLEKASFVSSRRSAEAERLSSALGGDGNSSSISPGTRISRRDAEAPRSAASRSVSSSPPSANSANMDSRRSPADGGLGGVGSHPMPPRNPPEAPTASDSETDTAGTRAAATFRGVARESAAAARSAACASEAPPGRNASRTSPAMSLVISRNGSSHTSFVLEPISFKELDT